MVDHLMELYRWQEILEDRPHRLFIHRSPYLQDYEISADGISYLEDLRCGFGRGRE